MADVTARDAKLIQYLTEAYGKERQLETALEAHIRLAARAPYRKRLQRHLTETRRHAREVERRIKRLGGVVDGFPVPVPDSVSERMSEAALRVLTGTQKAAALAQGPIHALRGTSEAEKQLKNAKDEYSDEAQEIATYTAIESLAESVGDRETRQLARSIRREEERMAAFLEKEIPRLTRAVAQAEIPASERRASRRATTRRRTRRASATGRTRTATTGRNSVRTGRATGARRTTSTRRGTATRRSTARGTARRSTARRSTARRSTARSTARRSTARSTARRSTARRSTASARRQPTTGRARRSPSPRPRSTSRAR